MMLWEWQKKPKPCLDIGYLMQALSLDVTEARALIWAVKSVKLEYGYTDWLGRWIKFHEIKTNIKTL